jgi:hypothetical protein
MGSRERWSKGAKADKQTVSRNVGSRTWVLFRNVGHPLGGFPELSGISIYLLYPTFRKRSLDRPTDISEKNGLESLSKMRL